MADISVARSASMAVPAAAILAIVGVAALAFGLAAAGPSYVGAAPHFVQEPAGIHHIYRGGFTFFVGGGVAAFDCDSDELPDLYFAGGSAPASLYRNVSAAGGAILFEDVDEPAADLTEVTGAYPLDIDSDGVVDLAVLRLGENIMLRGTGDCAFERANEAWSIDGGDAWTAAFSATWEANQQLPTLAFGNYLHLDDQGQQFGGCSTNRLIRPAGALYTSGTELTPGWCTLSMLFTDWSRTGTADLRVSNDRQYYRDGEEQLWRIEPNLAPTLYTEADGWEHVQIFGMGIASQDITGDGLPEVYLASMADNKLQTLASGNGQPRYTDIAFERAATAHRPFVGDATMPSTAWHPQFGDVNNDGFIDLFVTKGNVDAMAEAAALDPNNLLLGGPDGAFTEAAQDAGIVDFQRSRGAAMLDLNLDGLLDLVYVNREADVTLWRNTGTDRTSSADRRGNWIEIQLEQLAPNRDAIGSWIEVEVGGDVVTHEVTIGGGHASGQLGWIHFGLGSADRARLRVQWPDGEHSEWTTVAANRFLIVDRSRGVIEWEVPAG